MVHLKSVWLIPSLLMIFFLDFALANPVTSEDAKTGPNPSSTGGVQGQRFPADSSFEHARIDWRRYNGQTIKVLLSGHPIQGTILGLLSEFKELTGITVKTNVLPEEDFLQKLDIELAGGKAGTDVFMVAPLYQWKYAKAGWIEDLKPFLENPKLTDKVWYQPSDFFPILWKTSMWDGTIGGGLGQGALYSIPAWWEGCMLMYRKDLAAKFGFTEPDNWEALYRQVASIPKLTNNQVFGFNGRGIRSWSQIHTYHMTMMASHGASDLNPVTKRAAFNSRVGIEVGRYWVRLLQAAGSPNWPSYNWYEVTSDFQSGKHFAIMDANPFAIILEAEGSPIKDNVGYLLPPPGSKGRESFLWTWGLGINTQSKHKEAAWLFIQWVTSQSTLHQAIKYGNWMAPRQSVWFHPEVKAQLGAIDAGRWYANSTELVSRLAAMRWSPNPLAPMVGNIWAGAIQDAWRGRDTVEGALNKAAAQVDAMMKKAGYSE